MRYMCRQFIYLTSQAKALRHFFLNRSQNLNIRYFFCLKKYTITVSEPFSVVKKLEMVLVLAAQTVFKCRLLFLSKFLS